MAKIRLEERLGLVEGDDFVVDGVAYPRIQMLTVQDIFDGKRFKTPIVRGKRESRQSQMYMKPRKLQGEQLSLDMKD